MKFPKCLNYKGNFIYINLFNKFKAMRENASLKLVVTFIVHKIFTVLEN